MATRQRVRTIREGVPFRGASEDDPQPGGVFQIVTNLLPGTRRDLNMIELKYWLFNNPGGCHESNFA